MTHELSITVLSVLLIYAAYRMWTSVEEWLRLRKNAVEDAEYKKKYNEKKTEVDNAKRDYDNASRPYRDPKPPSDGTV